MQFLACLAELVFIHSCYIHSCILLDGLQHRKSPERRLEVNEIFSNLNLCLSVQLDSYLFQHLLHKLHHPDVVLVGHINFHAGELGIVGLVHSFVAEVLGELIYSVISSHDKPLEIKLIGDSQIQWDVEGIVMRNERPCGGTSRD